MVEIVSGLALHLLDGNWEANLGDFGGLDSSFEVADPENGCTSRKKLVRILRKKLKLISQTTFALSQTSGENN